MNIPSNLMLENRDEYLRQLSAPLKSVPAFTETGFDLVAAARCRRHALAYICNYGSDYVSVLDVNEARELAAIPVGAGPLDIAIHRIRLIAYVTNFIGNTLSVLDLRTNRTVRTVTMGKGPAGVRLSRDGRFLYVVHYEEPSVYLLDAITLEKLLEISLPSTGFDIDITADGSLAFVTLRSAAQLAVIDLSVNLVVKVIAAGAGAECVRISPTDRLAFVSNEDGNSLTAVNVRLAESAVPNIPAAAGPVGLAYTQGGSRLYCANRQDASVSLFDVFTHSEIASIPAGNGPYGAETVPGERLLVVTNTYEDTVSIIDTRENEVTSTAKVGFAPAFLSII